MIKIEYRLFELKHALETRTKKTYSWAKVAELSGVQINTVKNIAGNKTGRVDLSNVAKLMQFFANEGMPLSIDKFFTVTVDVSDAITHGESVNVEVQPPDKR